MRYHCSQRASNYYFLGSKLAHLEIVASHAVLCVRPVIGNNPFAVLLADDVMDAGGEIQLTDGVGALMKSKPVLALRFAGQRYDCGSKLGYLKAMLEMGLKHPETGAEFSEY